MSRRVFGGAHEESNSVRFARTESGFGMGMRLVVHMLGRGGEEGGPLYSSIYCIQPICGLVVLGMPGHLDGF